MDRFYVWSGPSPSPQARAVTPTAFTPARCLFQWSPLLRAAGWWLVALLVWSRWLLGPGLVVGCAPRWVPPLTSAGGHGQTPGGQCARCVGSLPAKGALSPATPRPHIK